MARHRMTAALAAVTSLGLALGGIALGFRELAPYFSSGYSDEERFAVLVGGDFYPGISRFGRNMYLDECTNVVGGMYAMFQPDAERNKLIGNCLVQIAALQASTPLDGRVWIVSAELEAAAGNLPAMRQAIQRSRAAAPGIAAYAIRRLNLLSAHGMVPGDEAGRIADLRVLFNGETGRAYLSELYMRSEADRELVTGLLDKQSLELQQKFVATLQRAQAGGA